MLRNKGSLAKKVGFVCKRCLGMLDRKLDKSMILDGYKIENVERFSYLGDVISTGGGVQEAATARIRAGWKKFKDISILKCVVQKRLVAKVKRHYL